MISHQVESLGGKFLKVPYEEDGSGTGGYAKEMSDECAPTAARPYPQPRALPQLRALQQLTPLPLPRLFDSYTTPCLENRPLRSSLTFRARPSRRRYKAAEAEMLAAQCALADAFRTPALST